MPSQRGRRYRCTVCGRTFVATTGTAAYRPHRPLALFVQVATLLAYGCPPAAIVAAFGLDERTVAAWQRWAGEQCERVHDALVLQPRDLGQMQADEIRVKRQGGIVWLALALAVPTRLWLGGVVSAQRDGELAQALAALVRRAAARTALLWSVDGWRPDLHAVTRAFRDPVPTGRRGRPRLVGWEGLAIGQVVKHHVRRHRSASTAASRAARRKRCRPCCSSRRAAGCSIPPGSSGSTPPSVLGCAPWSAVATPWRISCPPCTTPPT